MVREVSVIAIDGPVAAGKTVVGRELARNLGFAYLDTGIMYRAITWLALHSGIPVEDETSLGELAQANPVDSIGEEGNRVSVAGHALGPELREPSVEGNVSEVSKAPPVRRALVAQQRQIAGRGKIVMIGRDIGTVVLPDAPLKAYLDASAGERARRRHAELQAAGRTDTIDDVREQLAMRDEIDSQRDASPLRPAGDALVINTGKLTVQQVVDAILEAMSCS